MHEPTNEERLAYGSALLAVTRGDGVVSPGEREWILGAMAAEGTPESVLEQLAADPGDADPVALLPRMITSDGERWLESRKRTLIYNAIKACAADDSYHEGERAAVRRFAAAAGLTEDIVVQLEQLQQDDADLAKKKRVVLAIPQD
ncbi:hypothetical protein [Actinokineospora sp. HUAS TT18]|uniref:hypothetical protein n=1 Tax=Actinokineospora sp. HUAS TT18 TaxID=3447451 RepID=UPI003F51BE05